MKKNYKKMFAVLSLGFICVSTFGQGTWSAIKPDPTPGATLAQGTELGFGIFNLTAMNTAAEGVTQKSDIGAPADGIFTNEGILQANTTNATYYAIKTELAGVLKIALKLGANKPLYIYELAETNLATAAASGGVVSATMANATVVSATLSDASAFSEGMTFTATTYSTFTFNVGAGKIYAIGCTGSKLMLRGIDYSLPSAVNQVLSDKGISFNGKEVTNANNLPIEIYNVLGKKVAAASSTTISTANLQKGIYIVKAVGLSGTFKFSL
jgi:hypothetical protein